jgi:hypothetical protein
LGGGFGEWLEGGIRRCWVDLIDGSGCVVVIVVVVVVWGGLGRF